MTSEKALYVRFVAILEKKVVVDFRYRMLAFRGLAVSLLGFASGVSPVQLFQQESSTFRSNQLSEHVSLKETYKINNYCKLPHIK
jgi:hypothetical protein